MQAMIQLRIWVWLLCAVLADTAVTNVALCQESTTEKSGQWILVVPTKLRETAAPLIKLRQQQNWKTVLIDADGYVFGKTRVAEQSEKLRTDLNKYVNDFQGKTTVLLFGSWLGAADCRVPGLKGTVNRMKNQWSDHGFSQPAKDGRTTIAVGRFPARSIDEAKRMVNKAIRFEAWSPKQNDVHLIVAHPGGGTEFERTIASNVVKTAVNQRLKRVNPIWQPKCIMDVPGSEFAVASDKFGEKTKQLFETPHVFSVYSGHSMALGLYSTAGNVFSGKQFEKIDSQGPTGILVSCGCFGCQIVGPYGQGYGLLAVRSKSGPVAVIGAVDESYSAMGLLAFDGLLTELEKDTPPKTLGECWLAVQKGVTQGKISSSEFLMHDMADGSRGKVPLEKQRLEHAEMWTLLGDPAMTIPTQLKATKQQP